MGRDRELVRWFARLGAVGIGEPDDGVIQATVRLRGAPISMTP